MLWWLPSAIQAAGTIGKNIYDRNKRIPDFSSTAYGRYLKHKSQMGIYPETVKEKILSQIGAEAGNVEQQTRAKIRGQLLSQDMGTSVAGVRTLNEPSQDRMRGIITARKQLEIANEQSKIQAGEQYAQGETQTAEQQRLEKRGQMGELVGGVINTGTSLASGYMQNKIFEAQQTMEGLKLAMEERKIDVQEAYNKGRISNEDYKNSITKIHNEVMQNFEQQKIDILNDNRWDEKTKQDQINKLDNLKYEETVKHNREWERISEIKARQPEKTTLGDLQVDYINSLPPEKRRDTLKDMIDKKQMPAQFYLLTLEEQQQYLDIWARYGMTPEELIKFKMMNKLITPNQIEPKGMEGYHKKQ